MSRANQIGILSVLVALFAGCSTRQNVEVVDLNKVLDAVAAALDEAPARQDQPATDSDDTQDQPEDPQAEIVAIEPVDPDKEDSAKQDEFLKKLAVKLNDMKMIQSKIGVKMNSDGAIEGFTDPNSDMVKDANEKRLFLVEIDAARNRLIASDTYQNNRDYHYHPRPGGFFTGYLLGSMLGRQNSFYGSSGIQPDFGNRQMSPQNYHANAVSNARAAARRSASSSGSGSARSRGGSRGFSFGK
jgi:hypothetical protein